MDYSSLEGELKDALYWSPKGNNKKLIGALGIFLLIFSAFLLLNLKPLFSKEDMTSSIYGEAIENLENGSKQNQELLSSLYQDKNNRINILLIGIPGEPWPAPYLTDSIQIISINLKTQNALVIAIPRDFLVKIPGSGYETRINSLYSLENSPSILLKKLEEISGIRIQYYVIIDLKTLQKIVDIFGGIDVNVKTPIYDPLFPTTSRGYETFSLSAGAHHLDGKTTIKYIRSRHQKRGDFGRIERQQQVTEALKKKIIKLNIFRDFLKITALFMEFKDKTNFTIKEFRTLSSFAEKLSKGEIRYLVIDAGQPNSLLLYGQTILGGRPAQVLWPEEGKFNYAEIKKKINSLLKL